MKNTISIKTHDVSNVKTLTAAGVFTALITIMTAYICHIPVGTNGGYIHFGDSLIYLAAVLLPTPYSFLAAGIGGALADVLCGASLWAPATFIIKMLITIPFTGKKEKIVNARNIIGTVFAFLISGTGYFIAEAIIFGTKTAFISSMAGSLVQSGGSAICFILFGIALDKIGFKHKFLR